MPHVKPLNVGETEDAEADIAWLASATGFTANSMLALSHRPEIARAALGLIKAVVRNPNGTVEPGTSCRNWSRYRVVRFQ